MKLKLKYKNNKLKYNKNKNNKNKQNKTKTKLLWNLNPYLLEFLGFWVQVTSSIRKII